jgi:hypothetical protein
MIREFRMIDVNMLASELAHAKLMENWNESMKIFEGEEDDLMSTYTPEAQVIYNDYLDDYELLIKSCEE